MFSSWRRKIRQAEARIDSGQLKEASSLVAREQLYQFEPGIPLVARLIDALISHCRSALANNDYSKAWEDVSLASKMADLSGDQKNRVTQQKHRLVEMTIEHAGVVLADAKPVTAKRVLSELTRRHILDRRTDQLMRAADLILQADQSAAKGNTKAAVNKIQSAKKLRPDLAFLNLRLESLASQEQSVDKLTRELKSAMLGSQWNNARDISNQILAIAPNCTIAIDALGRCNEQSKKPDDPRVDLPIKNIGQTIYLGDSFNDSFERERKANDQLGIGDFSLSLGEHSRSFLLWIDGIGGYLVCASDSAMIGQAIPDSQVDIPILGDVHRRHASIRKTDGAHILTPFGPTRIDGIAIDEPVVLADGQRAGLGDSVELEYRKPHPLSATARMDIKSRHRTQPWADAVLLMADSLILGPRKTNHVVCPNWQNDLILFRRNDQWYCRSGQEFEIDGVMHQTEGPLHADSRICGDDFSLSLEYVR